MMCRIGCLNSTRVKKRIPRFLEESQKCQNTYYAWRHYMCAPSGVEETTLCRLLYGRLLETRIYFCTFCIFKRIQNENILVGLVSCGTFFHTSKSAASYDYLDMRSRIFESADTILLWEDVIHILGVPVRHRYRENAPP